MVHVLLRSCMELNIMMWVVAHYGMMSCCYTSIIIGCLYNSYAKTLSGLRSIVPP